MSKNNCIINMEISMERKEYEYTFKVASLQPFFDYCQKNGFTFVNKFKQIRTIYRNENKTMARITMNTNDTGTTKELDFKEDNWVAGAVVKELRESLPLKYESDDGVLSILEFLNYKKDYTMERTRYIYEKQDVKFEFDEYQQPKQSYIVAVEGVKDLVDKIYDEVKDLSPKHRSHN